MIDPVRKPNLFFTFVLLFILCGPVLTEALARNLILYSGRSKALVQPLIEKFEQEHGIRVQVRYGSSTQLAVAMLEEGRRTPADLFWAQDAGALGAVHRGDMLGPLPLGLLELVTERFHNEEGTWVATSGRARVLAYSPARTAAKTLPASVFMLADPEWRGRVGWAPGNASFQSFLTALRLQTGDEAALAWLDAMRENQAQSHINNSSLLQAIAAGEIDLALTNHYYLYRFREADASFPVEQTWFEAGDPGNMVNVAGIGVLRTSRNQEKALAFIRFLLEEQNQEWIAREVYEYPVLPLAEPPDESRILQDIEALSPAVDLDALSDLDRTLALLRQAGLL